jgi:3'(2'), 5'-bisphosphate nucleotidase
MPPDVAAAARLARDLVREGTQLAARMQGRVAVRDKGGTQGPVTEADLAVEKLILEGLRSADPVAAIVAEETASDVALPAHRLWCVDPIDGTREYAAGIPEWAVQIGLLIDGAPAAGACGLPDGTVYWGFPGGGAFRSADGPDEPVRATPCRDLAAAVLVRTRRRPGRRLADALRRLGITEHRRAGGCGFKAMMLLAQRAQIYLHAGGGTSWWDSAAPAAIVAAAGGDVRNARGEPLRYDVAFRHGDGLLFAVPGLLDLLHPRLANG